MTRFTNRCITCSLVFVLSACTALIAEDVDPSLGEKTEGDQPVVKRDWGKSKSGLAIAITPLKDTFDPWEPAIAEFVLGNVGDQDRRENPAIASSAAFKLYTLSVRLPDGWSGQGHCRSGPWLPWKSHFRWTIE